MVGEGRDIPGAMVGGGAGPSPLATAAPRPMRRPGREARNDDVAPVPTFPPPGGVSRAGGASVADELAIIPGGIPGGMPGGGPTGPGIAGGGP